MTYKVVTVSDRRPHEWYYLYDEFFKTLVGETPLVLNSHLMGTRFNGLGTKPRWLYKAIKEKIIDTSHIIFADCWDLVWCTTPDEIMLRYQSFNSPVVISAERNCFPADTKDEYDKLDSPTPYKYLNSGFIVGETEAILACLEAMDLPNQPEDHRRPDGTNFHLNDQALWLDLFLKQPVKMELDRYQALSQTLHDVDISEFDLSETRVRNKITNSYPCTLHFNGSAKDKLPLRSPLLNHLKLL